jgi:hypothetical protein
LRSAAGGISDLASGSLGGLYGDGEIVIRQGGREDCMYVVQEGRVEVFLEKRGRELCLAVRGEGGIERRERRRCPGSDTPRSRSSASFGRPRSAPEKSVSTILENPFHASEVGVHGKRLTDCF